MVPRAGAAGARRRALFFYGAHEKGAPPAGEGDHRARAAVQEPQEADVFFSNVASGEECFFITVDRIVRGVSYAICIENS